MENNRIRIVCYINQFFGQIGGEEKAHTGIIVKDEPIGPTMLFDKTLKDLGDVVGTIICGDNYFSENTQEATEEALKHIKELKPDIFIAGPSFTAGRYGMNCGAIATAVSKELGIPCITGMSEEAPAVPIYRKDIYILKTAGNARRLKEAVDSMSQLARKFILGQRIGSAKLEGYFIRDRLVNELSDKTSSQRAIQMLKNRLNNEEWVSEIGAPKYKKIESPAPIKDISNAKIAIVSDGGYIPTGNPDKIKSAGATSYGVYNLNHLVDVDGMVIHAGYDKVFVNENPNRLLPRNILRNLEDKGVIGSLAENTYITTGNVMALEMAQKIGAEIANNLIRDGIDGVILTST